jgi:hypothetical protein
MKEQEVRGGKSGARTLKVHEWPTADQLAWEAACKPSHRLTKGGSASHLAPVSQEDIASRYGLFLGFLRLKGSLNPDAEVAAHVTPANVEAYDADLARRVSSVTAWNCIYKVRRAAQLLAQTRTFYGFARSRMIWPSSWSRSRSSGGSYLLNSRWKQGSP